MFSEAAPPLPWDERKEYTRTHIKLYYCAYAGTILKESQLVEALQGEYPSNYVEIGVKVCAPHKHSSFRALNMGGCAAQLVGGRFSFLALSLASAVLFCSVSVCIIRPVSVFLFYFGSGFRYSKAC
jgi:hypothetical protein